MHKYAAAVAAAAAEEEQEQENTKEHIHIRSGSTTLAVIRMHATLTLLHKRHAMRLDKKRRI